MKALDTLNITADLLKPTHRRLRGYAFDPSFANQLESSGVNTITYHIRWENLAPGPLGKYLEVVDVDPASGAMYPPVDLEDPQLLAQDGLPPSESNPQFHQQMVYAVAMLTIQNFEKALGRRVQWSSPDASSGHEGEPFIRRLRLYPHAFRGANAYYSSLKKAVLFGYFSARPSSRSLLMPGSMVFSCLSHDIIAHEVTHALIDGIHKRFILPIHEDTLAVHEALADIVALFQHFTFPEILENQIARTRGNLSTTTWLTQLAHQFGLAIGQYKYLRDAIEKPADPQLLSEAREPHARGSVLVAAMFKAFVNVYNQRTADLYRIATNGRGVLPKGEIHPDLVRRLAAEASHTARQFLLLFIRAFDYCPPVGTTFGDLLRAMITADVDLVLTDPLNYRVALLESFKQWGIYPENVQSLSVESLTHRSFSEKGLLELGMAINNIPEDDQPKKDALRQEIATFLKLMRKFYNATALKRKKRRALFNIAKRYRDLMHQLLARRTSEPGKRLLQGLLSILLLKSDYQEFVRLSIAAVNEELTKEAEAGSVRLQVATIEMALNKLGEPLFEVHALNRAQRVGPAANVLNQVVLTIMQECRVKLDKPDFSDEQEWTYTFRGGSTLVVDLDKNTMRVINRGTMRRFFNYINVKRLARELLRRYAAEATEGESPFAPSMWAKTSYAEPFALLHRHA